MSIRALVMDEIMRRVIRQGESDVQEEVARRKREGAPTPAEVPAAVSKRFKVERAEVDGSSVISLRHSSDAPSSVVFLAGGGYAHPISRSHWSVAARFARESGLDFVVPLYRVAPEGDAQRGHHFVSEVLAGEIAAKGDGRVFLMGDSAGAGLALSVLQQRPAGVAGAVLLSPWLDIELTHPAAEVLEPVDVILNVGELRQWGRIWAADVRTSDPLVSPLNGSFADLPPVHIVTGGRDLLLPDALEAYRRLKAAGNTGSLTYEPDGNHALGLMGSATPEAARAFRAVVRALTA